MKTAPQINALLIRPQYSFNIGSCVRALANNTSTNLHIIDPQCELGVHFRKGAAGAQDFAKKVKIYSSFEDFFKEQTNPLLIAMTRRHGKRRQALSLDECFERVQESEEFISSAQKLFLVFGQEDHGLSQEDILQTHISCFLPLNGPFQSLNLSQAVLLATFLFQKKINEFFDKPELRIQMKPKEALQEDALDFFPDQSFKTWLKFCGFSFDKSKNNIYTTLKSMLMRSIPTQKEMKNFESAMQQSMKKNPKQY